MVDLLPNEEQEGLQLALREFLLTAYPLQHAQRAKAAQSIRTLASLGWLGVGLSPEIGGSGLGVAQEALTFREFGRVLAPPSVLASVIGAHTALDAANTEIAQAMLNGDASVGLALPHWSATGRDDYLLLGQAGDQFVLVLEGRRVTLVSADSVRERRMLPSTDPEVLIEHVKIQGGAKALSRGSWLWPRVQVLIAAFQLGIAEGACDLSVAYGLMREQFGRQIAGFQAIKHRCVDARIRSEAAHWQVVYAALALENEQDDAFVQTTSALIIAEDAALGNARDAIQVHGGMGFTDECAAHLFLKRAHVFSRIAGGRARQLALMATL